MSHVPLAWLRLAALLALTLALLPDALAQDARRMTTERVRFARGASGATLSSTVAGGRAERYLVSVEAGQTMTVSVENYGDDGLAVFQVYAPGRRIVAANAAPSSDGARHDLAHWTGRLSRSGDYQIVVYPTSRGRGASYDLSVAVW